MVKTLGPFTRGYHNARRGLFLRISTFAFFAVSNRTSSLTLDSAMQSTVYASSHHLSAATTIRALTARRDAENNVLADTPEDLQLFSSAIDQGMFEVRSGRLYL